MPEEMGRADIDAFLTDAGVGVLSLTDGAETYAVPESFGYDGKCLYFQFVFDADSTKMSFVETTAVATLTAFTRDPPRSVVVRGRLEAVPEDETTAATAALAENASVPTLNVYPETETDDLSMALYRLVPDERSGRTFDGFAPEP